MASLDFDARKHDAILRSELEQRVAGMNDLLHLRGLNWCDRLDQMVTAFENHDQDPWRVLGKLAQIGFIYCLTEMQGVNVTDEPPADE